jgi:hypothetical protein
MRRYFMDQLAPVDLGGTDWMLPRIDASVSVSAAITIQSCFDAVDQAGTSEGLRQEANGSGLQCSGADALFGERCDKNEWRIVTLGTHMRQQVQAAHGRHLHIRNHT